MTGVQTTTAVTKVMGKVGLGVFKGKAARISRGLDMGYDGWLVGLGPEQHAEWSDPL